MPSVVDYSAVRMESARPTVLSIIGHLCALGVAGFFIYAAWGKIIDVQQFAIEIRNYKMAFLDPKYVNIPAILLPWIEVAAALALIYPKTRKAGAVVVGAMLLFFIYAVFDAAIVRGLNISCGCTGKDSGPAGWTTIGRNVGLLIATIASVWITNRQAARVAARESTALPAVAVDAPAA